MILFICAASAIVQKIKYTDMKQKTQSGQSYVLAISTLAYDYLQVVDNFADAAHQSGVKTNFFILDTDEENVEPSDFNISSFPSIIEFLNGKPRNTMSPPFAINSILSFVNQHAKQSIPYIKTKEELQNFFQISSLGVLAAFEDASETTLPALSEFFFKYYNQLSLSFCDPSLVSKPGFYLYRFEDNAFLECPGLANATNEEEVANVLTPYTVPIIHKLNPAVVDVLETDKQKFIILSLKMSDNYYLTPDQINLAKSLMDDSGFNVTFIPFDYFNLPNSRYGFPDLQKEVMCLIDASGKKVTKYFYSGEVTFEKCAQFIRDVKEGKQKRYLMSAPHQDGKEIEEINAIELQDFTRNEKSILGIYYSDDNCLVPLVESKKTIQKIFPDARIGQFSLYRNDWSGEDTKTIELPRLVLYSKGKLLQNIQLPNTTDAAVRYIIEQYQNMEL